MDGEAPVWRRYVECRPDELEELVRQAPVVYWPLGLIEHHGWHLPVGFDGLKAERACAQCAALTGGLLLPTMWWGGLGGHGHFKWTHYQAPEACEAMLVQMTEQLISFGLRVIVFFAGHYPWESLLKRRLPEIQRAHPDVLLLWGTEANLGRPQVILPGDHAAREETSYGLYLLPEFVDMAALRPGHSAAESWPGGARPDAPDHPGVIVDPAEPLFAQYGVDARLASAERGEDGIRRLVAHLAGEINAYLAGLRS